MLVIDFGRESFQVNFNCRYVHRREVFNKNILPLHLFIDDLVSCVHDDYNRGGHGLLFAEVVDGLPLSFQRWMYLHLEAGRGNLICPGKWEICYFCIQVLIHIRLLTSKQSWSWEGNVVLDLLEESEDLLTLFLLVEEDDITLIKDAEELWKLFFKLLSILETAFQSDEDYWSSINILEVGSITEDYIHVQLFFQRLSLLEVSESKTPGLVDDEDLLIKSCFEHSNYQAQRSFPIPDFKFDELWKGMILKAIVDTHVLDL